MNVTAPADEGDQPSADVVQYADDTTVEVDMASDTAIEMTADRDRNRGRVVITSISREAFDATDDISVTVDGEAAARAESAEALRTAADGGGNSAFMVRPATTASAKSDVVIAINHISERSMAITSEDGDGSSGDDGGSTTGGDGPGFGVLVAIVALIGAALIAMRRRNC